MFSELEITISTADPTAMNYRSIIKLMLLIVNN